MTSITVAGGKVEPEWAVKITRELVSKITSCTPTSHENKTATSMAFASASKGPNGRCRCWLRAAMIVPAWSRITVPMPTELRFLKIDASVFILNHGFEGGTEWVFDGPVCWGHVKWATLFMISFKECRGGPCRVLFRFYHMHHAMVMISSSKSWPTCCLKMRYQTRSMKSQYYRKEYL